ncbi:MAG: S-layer homology domain-containing protein [Acidobacteriota bacterium]
MPSLSLTLRLDRPTKYFLYILTMLIVAIELLIAPIPRSDAATTFNDLPDTNPNYPYAKFLQDKKILSGYEDGRFLPDNSISRAEMAVLITKALSLKPISPNKPSYKDVKAKHWAYSYIERGKQAGLIKGFPDGTFRPDVKITRAQTAILLLSLTKEQLPMVSVPSKIADVRPGYWARPYIAAAIDSSILPAVTDSSFYPEKPVTRIEVARGLAVTITLSPELRQVPLLTECVPQKGTVSITIPGSASRKITKALLCPKGTAIKTDAESECDLKFPDGSSILMKSSSELIIKEARGQLAIKRDGSPCILIDDLEITLPTGKIYGGLASTYFKSNTIENGESNSSNKPVGKSDLVTFAASKQSETARSQWYKQASTSRVRVKVDMPWTVAGIRGTFWANAVSSTGQSSTSVITGDVTVTSGGSTVSVGSGQSTTVSSAGAPPAPPSPMPAAEQQAWSQVQTWVMQTATEIQNNAPVPPPTVTNTTETTTETNNNSNTQTVVTQVTEAFNNATGNNSTSSTSSTPSGGGGTVSDTTAPTVSATSPASGAANVSPTVYLYVDFNEPVQTDGMLSGYNLLREGSIQVEILGVSIPSGYPNRVLIKTGKLEYSSNYSLNIAATSVKDLAGNPCSAISMSFTTEADTYPPIIADALSVSPNNRAVTIPFSEPLYENTGTGLLNYVYLAPDGSSFSTSNISDVSISSNSLVVQVYTAFSGSLNQIKISSSSLKDSIGNVQSSELVTSTFAADETAPTLVSSNVASTARMVYLNFDEAVYDNTSGVLRDSVYVADDGSNFLPLDASDTVNINLSVLELSSINKKLEGNNTKFRVAAGALKDQAGNISGLATTVALNDPAPPVYLSVYNSGSMTIVLNYDENLDSLYVPATTAIKVKVNSSYVTCTSASISGKCLIIQISTSLILNDSVEVTCLESDCSTNYLRDKAGNHAGDLSTGTFITS